MNKLTWMGEPDEWYEVLLMSDEHVCVVPQKGVLLHPKSGQVGVRMLACGICGADVRYVTGRKATTFARRLPIRLGHEGVGIVGAIGDDVTGIKTGDVVALMPHLYPASRCAHCTSPEGAPRCIGKGCPRHAGWDADGLFTDYLLWPASNVVRIAPEDVQQAAELTPGLPPGAIFAYTEPVCCVLSAHKMMEQELQRLARRELTRGKAAVFGCGPVGFLNALVLLNRGWEVYVTDEVPKRARLLQGCLDNRVQLFDPTCDGDFDLVMVAVSSAKAIKSAEVVVKEHGVVYLFAGLNTEEQSTMDEDKVLFYERIHRVAVAVMTTTRQVRPEKVILYMGHSGYWTGLATKAVATVVQNAGLLNRAVTGLLRGWMIPSIESRLLGGRDWTTGGTPAIVKVLNGTDLRETHLKLVVLTGAGHTPGGSRPRRTLGP